MKIPLGLLLVCCISTLDPASAEPIYEFVRKWENPQGPVNGRGDQFGLSLDRVGDKLLVGAWADDTGAPNSGAAYLFDLDGNLLTTFLNPTPGDDERFAYDVRGFGEKIIIGARQDSSQVEKSGAVYVYETDGTLLQTIMNPTPETNDQFGRALTALGENILVTAKFDNENVGEMSGAAYLFDQQGELLRTFFMPNANGSDAFGRRVAALSEDKFVISTAETIGGYTGAGSIYVYDIDGSEPLRIPNPEPFSLDSFGSDVAIVGNDKILVGALQDDTDSGISAGAAFLYDLSGNLLHRIDNPTPEQLDWFGRDLIGVTDDTFIIGAIFDDTLGGNTGAAYLFNTDGELLQTFLSPDSAINAQFGVDFTVIDDRLFIGNHFDGGRFDGAGAVYEYRLVPEPSTWLMLSIGAVMLAIGRRRKVCRDGGKQ